MKSSIELIADFICPYEDNLTFAFIGDNFDTDTIALFNKFISKTRKSLPSKLNKINFIIINSSDLFRGKYTHVFTNNICIQFLDSTLSLNMISYLTNSLEDEMEGMLIDKHLLQIPQEKYIFDITYVSDDTLARLCHNMDLAINSYNYIISENYLAIWILHQNEFSLIQDKL